MVTERRAGRTSRPRHAGSSPGYAAAGRPSSLGQI